MPMNTTRTQNKYISVMHTINLFKSTDLVIKKMWVFHSINNHIHIHTLTNKEKDLLEWT